MCGICGVCGCCTQHKRSQKTIVVGGNTPAGVVGQISGLLELAEQIEKGEIADVDAIYLPIGSSCTISG